MSTLSRDEVREMLPAYALDALDADERQALEDGLARYPDLRAELAQLGGVAYGLGAGVPQRIPPAALKAQLLAQAAPNTAPAPAPTPRPTWWQRFKDALSNTSLAPKLATAALVLAALFVGLQAVMMAARPPGTVLPQTAQTVLANSTQSVQLNGTDKAPGATATIHYRPEDKVAALQVTNLPPVSDAQSYQLWLVNDEGFRWSGAVFNTGPAGDSLVLVNCAQPMETIARFGVSIEPAGGSDSPTGPGVLRSAQS